MIHAGQAIVKTVHPDQLNAPGCLHVPPNAFARLPMRWFRVLNFLTNELERLEAEMKLNVFFFLIDVMILLAYPFIFIAAKLRKFFNFKG